jgi:N-methylhydantoinase B
MIIYEALDFTVGLFDAEGNILSIGLGLPMFIRGIADTIRAKLKHFGPDGIEPGDILLTNDVYITGSHLNHMTFSVPIFHDGRLVAFSGCMAHWPDVGGTLDGITTDIFSEGLQMPIVKAYRRGRAERGNPVDHPNERTPAGAGDGRPQGADRLGQNQREALPGDAPEIRLRRGGGGDRRHHGARARRGRANGCAPSDGVYEAESFMDDDGVVAGQRVPIRVKIIVAGDQMTIDLTDVSQQVSGFYNSGETAGKSCCGVAFKCLTSPLDLPINEGQFRALDVILPPGRMSARSNRRRCGCG